jgi:hypothetical protein
MCGCTSSYNGVSDLRRRKPMNNFQGEKPAFIPELNFEDLDSLEEKSGKKKQKKRAKRKAKRKAKKASQPNDLTLSQRDESIDTEGMGMGADASMGMGMGADASMGMGMGADASMGMGMGADADAGQGKDKKLGFFTKNKTMLLVAGAGALVVGGYFLFGKQLGIRK